jgi:hypothetical protein
LKYVKFTEENEWEGETWRFWLPYDGNEEALRQLMELNPSEHHLVGVIPGDSFTLDLSKFVDEPTVDAFVANVDEGDDGYMPPDQKVEGVLDISPLVGLSNKDAEQFLYKGGIRDLFTTA